jgi:type IV secretory pathway VirB3-like protein
MNPDVEDRLARIERRISRRDRMEIVEGVTLRIAGFIALLLTILVVLLNKLDDFISALVHVFSTISQALGK